LVSHSAGRTITDAIHAAVLLVPASAWTQDIEFNGEIRHGARVAELAGGVLIRHIRHAPGPAATVRSVAGRPVQVTCYHCEIDAPRMGMDVELIYGREYPLSAGNGEEFPFGGDRPLIKGATEGRRRWNNPFDPAGQNDNCYHGDPISDSDHFPTKLTALDSWMIWTKVSNWAPALGGDGTPPRSEVGPAASEDWLSTRPRLRPIPYRRHGLLAARPD
jgi:hypothetical protein